MNWGLRLWWISRQSGMWWTTPVAAGATLRKTWPRRSWCICTRTAIYHMCGCPHLTWAQRVRRIWGTYGNKFSNHWCLYFIPDRIFCPWVNRCKDSDDFFQGCHSLMMFTGQLHISLQSCFQHACFLESQNHLVTIQIFTMESIRQFSPPFLDWLRFETPRVGPRQ